MTPLLAAETSMFTAPTPWVIGIVITAGVAFIKLYRDSRKQAKAEGVEEGEQHAQLKRIDEVTSRTSGDVSAMRETLSGLSSDVRRIDHDLGRQAEEAEAARRWRSQARDEITRWRGDVQANRSAILALADEQPEVARRLIEYSAQEPPTFPRTPRPVPRRTSPGADPDRA